MPPHSLRALLNRIVDYAGLFPPAKLDMASTVRNYKKYLQSGDSWMLGRLIVPVARLAEFEREAADLLPRKDEDDPWSLGVLAGPAGAPQFAADLEAIESFNIRHEDGVDGRAYIDVLEIKADSAEAIDATLEILPQEYFAFFELPIESDPRGLIATLGDGEAGAKVRTGGVTADLIPSPQNLARFIAACAAANVPFKATAGLHQPLRHHSEFVKAEEFGFLNVFLAGCLAMTSEMDEAEVLQLLQETSIDAIEIRDESVTWRDHRIEADSIEDVREEFAISFGSCSFDEPHEGLRQLNLL
jgi:hypothetical protein